MVKELIYLPWLEGEVKWITQILNTARAFEAKKPSKQQQAELFPISVSASGPTLTIYLLSIRQLLVSVKDLPLGKIFLSS